jgi:hypothetical protein
MRAPWQSRVTPEATISTPRVQVHDGSRWALAVWTTRVSASVQGTSCEPGSTARTSAAASAAATAARAAEREGGSGDTRRMGGTAICSIPSPSRAGASAGADQLPRSSAANPFCTCTGPRTSVKSAPFPTGETTTAQAGMPSDPIYHPTRGAE